MGPRPTTLPVLGGPDTWAPSSQIKVREDHTPLFSRLWWEAYMPLSEIQATPAGANPAGQGPGQHTHGSSQRR